MTVFALRPRLLRLLLPLLVLVFTAISGNALAGPKPASGQFLTAATLIGAEPLQDATSHQVVWKIAPKPAAACCVAAEEAAAGARGLSGLGGVFSSETNAAGGTIWTSVGDISQNDVAPLVNSGMYNGEVNIISGVHGALNGSTAADLSLYEADVARFGNLPGVNVYNFPEMTPGQINGLLNGPGTTIGGFCNSGACLAPLR